MWEKASKIIILACKYRIERLRSYVIKCKYAYNKVYRVSIITIIGLVLIGMSIFLFTCLYYQTIPDLEFSRIFYCSASIYISGNERDLVYYSHLQYLIILEQFVSFIINNTFLATITYNMFKTYNNVFLSKNLYILEQEGSPGCYVIRFRIGDINNDFANYSYSMQFFCWYKNEYKDPYYSIRNDIPELEYVYNEDNCLFYKDRNKITDLVMNTDPITADKNAQAIAKIIFASDNVFYAHNSICITLTAMSTKTSEPIIIRRYYGKKNIKLVSQCKDVFKWDASRKGNKTPIMWHHIDEFSEMNGVNTSLVKNTLKKKLDEKQEDKSSLPHNISIIKKVKNALKKKKR